MRELSERQKDNKRARRRDLNHFDESLCQYKGILTLEQITAPFVYCADSSYTSRCRGHHLRPYSQSRRHHKPHCSNNLHTSRITPAHNSQHYIKPEFACYLISPRRTDPGDVPNVELWPRDTGGRWFAVRERRSRARPLQRGNGSRTVSQTSRRPSRLMQRQDLANPRWRRETR
jgi:hypothetical protein